MTVPSNRNQHNDGAGFFAARPRLVERTTEPWPMAPGDRARDVAEHAG